MRVLYTTLAFLILAVGAAFPLAAQSVKLVTVSCGTTTLAYGSRTTCVARARTKTGQFAPGKSTGWLSSKPDIAVVSDKGVVSSIAPGMATITASVQGVSGSVTITVTNPNPSPPPPPIAPVVSLNVTLGATTLPVGQTTQAVAVPRDSSGDVLMDRVVTWASVTPGIASVSGAGLVTALSAGTATIRCTVDTKTTDVSLTVTALPTPPANDTSKASAVLRLVGPTIAVSSVPSSATFYETRFRAYADTQWTQFGPQWDAGNSISGYERGAIYYTWWARSGDTTYLSRAHQTAVNYRDGYLIPAGYATSPHWSQMETLYLDWLVTGDTKSRDAVTAVAGRFTAFLSHDTGQPSYIQNVAGADQDSRIQARIMIAEWMQEKIAGTRNQWLDSAIVQTLSTLNAQGFTAWTNTCGGDLNYMSGMVYDVLTRIHDQRTYTTSYNSAIEAKAAAQGTYLWSTQWRGGFGDNSFNYLSLLCNGTGSPSSAPDLNGLILPLFGWLGKTTGDSTWFSRGDLVLAGMQQASVYLYRQFSESYYASHRYLGYRYSGSVIPAGGGSRIRRPARQVQTAPARAVRLRIPR